MGLADCVSLGNLDAFQAVVSNDPAPDCVVEVEYQDLSTLTPERGDDTGHVIGIKRNKFVRKGNLGQVPKLRVMPVRNTDGLRNSCDIQQDIVRMENKLNQLAVYAVDQT